MNDRATTRSASQVDPSLLLPPQESRRRGRSQSRDERLRSPNNLEIEEGLVFNFEPTMADVDALRAELRAEIRAEFRNETAAAAAANPDAIRRKPEIPNFDKDHIEIWIKRTENSYIRANVTSVQEKFAFLETKFPVNFDPRVDEFLYGAASEDNWTAFLKYLRAEFGPTKQQRASVFIDGIKRDGRKPSQYAAALDDRTKGTSIDDIKKEMLLREMPTDVRRMLQERIETLSFKEAAEIADSYFDSEGRPRHAATSISHVSAPFEDVSTNDEPDAISAIPRRFPQRKNANPPRNPQGEARQPQQKGWPARKANNNTNSKPAGSREANPKFPMKTICSFHFKYGDNARNCEVGCARFDEKRFPGNGQAGHK